MALCSARSIPCAAMLTSLQAFLQLSSPSFINTLDCDPDTLRHAPNTSSREVLSGHYVLVRPTPLPSPHLIAFSEKLFEELTLAPSIATTNDFLRFFSGDFSILQDMGMSLESWATPYALSINGDPIIHNCPFGTGNGYGDGRAMSVAEILIPSSKQRYEFQLKGGGRTPFCRSGDGRAVLRSSVREYIASEAMFALGVSTTRALSLIKSETAVATRPWYSPSTPPVDDIPSLDDPRLASIPANFRSDVLQHLLSEWRQPNKVGTEPCAITCRVARSFIRVGHFELFYRRMIGPGNSNTVKQTAKNQLIKLLDHAISREYSEVLTVINESSSVAERTIEFLKVVSQQLSLLVADWIRVGYCQGNFNSDNCLVGGRTMDYGPFGFTEKFEKYWNMWLGGGKHFGFLNQGNAGIMNYRSLLTALSPLLVDNDKGDAAVMNSLMSSLLDQHKKNTVRAISDVWRRKLGLQTWTDDADLLINDALTMMEHHQADYILFWRLLPSLLDTDRVSNEIPPNVLRFVSSVFYRPLNSSEIEEWMRWRHRWSQLIHSNYNISATESLPSNIIQNITQQIHSLSPIYVPREWLLAEVYSAAADGDYTPLNNLFSVLQSPYVDQPGSERFAQRAPSEVYQGLGKGGIAFMT